jgi:hypothetical protein
MSQEIYLERLQKLANSNFEEVIIGTNRERFSFAVLNSGVTDEKGCGTAGCLMGEFPMIFPEFMFSSKAVGLRLNCDLAKVNGNFEFKESELPEIGAFDKTDKYVCLFFGLTPEQEYHLFYPHCQKPELYGGRDLSHAATREKVISNLKIFIEKVKAGEVKLGNY